MDGPNVFEAVVGLCWTVLNMLKLCFYYVLVLPAAVLTVIDLYSWVNGLWVVLFYEMFLDLDTNDFSAL